MRYNLERHTAVPRLHRAKAVSMPASEPGPHASLLLLLRRR